jgi:dipeptidase E
MRSSWVSSLPTSPMAKRLIEYFPHLNEDERFLPALLHYSETISHPIVACRDGEGLIVGNGTVEIFGAPLLVSGGSAEVATQRVLVDLSHRTR